MSGDDVSLYIHIPFCKKKCGYCHFYVVAQDKEKHKGFFQSLAIDYELIREKIESRRLVSIYFGGGTPSLADPADIKKFLSLIRFQNDTEITLEANPELITKELLEGFKDAGITRISFGAQSVDEGELKILERGHGKKEIEHACMQASKLFERVSLDLLFDVPTQTLKSWQRTLSFATSLPINHVSLYNLTIDPGSSFFRRKEQYEQKNDTLSKDFYLLAKEHLTKHHLVHYELASFAHPGAASLHNIGYWTNRVFYGIGPSAFSFNGASRMRKIANLIKWQKELSEGKEGIDFQETLEKDALEREAFILHLRLFEGVPTENIPEGVMVGSLIKEGFLREVNKRIFLTEKGELFFDHIAAELV